MVPQWERSHNQFRMRFRSRGWLRPLLVTRRPMKLHMPGRSGHRTDQTADEAPAAGEPGPDAEVERAAPDTPTGLPKRSWGAALKGSLREFKDDQLTDRAAALTYYGVLSLFPALLVLVSLLGIAGKSAIDRVMEQVEDLAPGAVRDILTQAVSQLQGGAGTGSIVALVGLVLAVWSASGYVAAF